MRWSANTLLLSALSCASPSDGGELPSRVDGAGMSISASGDSVSTAAPPTADGPLLARLTLSLGPLSEGFRPTLLDYTARATYAQTETTVTATAADDGATLRVNGVATPSGAPSHVIALPLGSTPVTIDVEDADRDVITTYLVDIQRDAAPAFFQRAYIKASNAGAGDHFGNSVAIDGETMVVAARYEQSAASGIDGDQHNDDTPEAGAVYVFSRVDDTWSQQAYIKASNVGEEDTFGHAVVLDGDTLAVGAIKEDSGTTGINGDESNEDEKNAGAVYVFTRTGTTWSQQAYIKAANAGASDWFGASLSLDGDTLTVGARYEDGGASGVNGVANDDKPSAGAAYVFTRTGGTWQQQAYVKASNAGFGDQFGFSIALNNDTLAVGALNEDSSAFGVGGDQDNDDGVASGAVYIFRRSGDTWSQEAYIKASNPDRLDSFGTHVALDGDTLVVGTYQEASDATGVNGNQDNNDAASAGAIYVFTRSGTLWSQQAYIKASNTEAADLFGAPIALEGDLLAVGAVGEDSASTGLFGDPFNNDASKSGAVYVFVRSGTLWTQQAYIKATNGQADDCFGGALAVDNGTLVVGAVGEDSNASGVGGDALNNAAIDAGAVYVLQ